jgi:hypothetical protein
MELMNLLIKVSKEEKRMHVILTSSDSFFPDWLQKQGVVCSWIWTLRLTIPNILLFAGIASIHINTLILDHMSKEDASRYYEKLIQHVDAAKKLIFNSVDASFDFVYSMTRGNMHLIDLFVSKALERNTIPSGKRKIRLKPAEKSNLLIHP